MRSGRWRWLLCLGALAGCGDNLAASSRDAHSGSRLKLAWFEYEDGTRQPELGAFFDRDRGEACGPRVWSSGATYCTPAAREAVFVDAACTSLLGQVAPGGPPPPYFILPYSIAGRAQASRMFVAGGLAAPVAQTWRLRDGLCDGPIEGSDADYYALGPEIDRDRLVRLRQILSTTDARLGLAVLQTDDGLNLPLGLVDRQLGACTVDERDDPTATCIPDVSTTAYFFRDSTCSEPEVAIARDAEQPVLISQRSSETGCSSFHRAGAQVGSQPLYRRLGVTCTATIAPDDALFLLGPALELATIQREQEVGPGRLNRIVLRGENVELAAGSLFDTVTSRPCDRAQVEGVTRCLPRTAPARQLFSDELCTIPTVIAELTAHCGAAPGFAIVEPSELHAIAAPLARIVYEITTGDRCVPFLTAASTTLHEVGAALPITMFPAATRVVDP